MKSTPRPSTFLKIWTIWIFYQLGIFYSQTVFLLTFRFAVIRGQACTTFFILEQIYKPILKDGNTLLIRKSLVRILGDFLLRLHWLVFLEVESSV
jgi:hypothetical protein